MSLIYRTIKYTGIIANLVYMLLGIGIIFAAGYGLAKSQPETAEHTYFIQNIVLGGMICLIVIFGFYGLVSDLFAVNIIFTVFILLILGVHYIQMRDYQPHLYYDSAVQRLEHAWLQMQRNKSQPMQGIERQYRCCGYYNAHDYNNLHLTKPATCYNQQLNDIAAGANAVQNLTINGCLIALNKIYNMTHKRDRLFNWCTIGLELFLLVQTIIFSILVYRRRQAQRIERRLARLSRRYPQGNHAGSRTMLIV